MNEILSRLPTDNARRDERRKADEPNRHKVRYYGGQSCRQVATDWPEKDYRAAGNQMANV
jgi:hypothetical protein